MKFYPSFKLSITWIDLFIAIKDLLFVSNTKEQNLNFLKQYINKKYIMDIPSSRWGLVFILKGLNFEYGSEIIIPAYTYFAVPAAILRAGLNPVFIDLEKDSINMDENKIEGLITPKTKAIIATHLCGFPCNLEKINKIAKKYNLVVIEDCAQSLGSEYSGKNTGDYSTASYYSLSITKNLTMLTGGIIATDDDNLAKYIKQQTSRIKPLTKFITFKLIIKASIMKFATSKIITPFTCLVFLIFSILKIDITKLIFKEKKILLNKEYPKYGKLNYIQKHLAIRQLKYFENNNKIKEQNGKLFYKLVSKVEYCKVPKLLDNCKNIFSNIPLFVKNRSIIRRKLLKKGIDSSYPFVQCCPKIEEFQKYTKLEYPNALYAEQNLLYFISSSKINIDDIKYIIRKFKNENIIN